MPRLSQRRSSRQYLNGILTVNAVLLAALVWTNVTTGPSRADAAAITLQDDEPALGVPNAGAQRERMISELRGLREDVRQLDQTINGGKLRLNISNFAELKKIIDEANAKAAAAQQKQETNPPAVTPSTGPAVTPKP